MTALDEAPVLEPGCTPDVLAAEKAVLGMAIGSSRVADRMIEILPAEDCFALSQHRAVYAAVRYLAEAGKPVDHASVLGRLVATERGEWRTGHAGIILASLAEHASPDWEAHAQAVMRAARRRRGLAALDTARQMLASETDPDLDVTADDIRTLLDAALTPATGGSDLIHAGDLFRDAVDRLQAGLKPGVIQFPWRDLRGLVPYLRAGQLCTIAARPSLGKSLSALDLARYVAFDQGIPVALFTMEQDRDEVADRLIAAEAGVLLDSITNVKLDDDDWARIDAVSERFADSRLVLDDTPKVSPAHVRARLRGMSRDPVRLVIVDYLQLMEGAAGENRQREVSALVAGLKSVAREFRIPVVMLCQLNRGPEHRSDKRPYMSDARESGAVENDSDVAILIHRPDFYDPNSDRPGEVDLIVDKNRNGPRGTVTVGFQGHYARFVDLARVEPPANWKGDR